MWVLIHRTELGLFALGIAVASLRIGVLSLNPSSLVFDDRFETLNVARTLAETGGFGNPFRAGPTGPTAHVAPVYPAVGAALYRLPVSWPKALSILGIVLMGLTAAALPLTSRAFFGTKVPGIYAGLIGPFCLWVTPQHEVQLSSFLLMAACVAVVLSSSHSWWTCGLAVLANPAALIPIAVLSIGRRFTEIMTIAAGILVICLPWVVRNWEVLGSPSPIRDNFGMELYVSNNDCAPVTIVESIVKDCLQSKHPSFSAAENARLRTVGEVQYNRERLRDAVIWMRTHVRRFAALTAGRAMDYWFPSPDMQGPAALGVQILTMAAFASLAARLVEPRSLLVAAAVLSWLPYVFIQSDLRYRSFTLWMWLLIAGQAIEAFIRPSSKTPGDGL